MARRAPAREEPNAAAPAAEPAPLTTPPSSEEAPAAVADLPGPMIDAAAIARILPAKVLALLKLPTRWIPLFAEACLVYGLDPNPSKKPRQLLAHRLIDGDPDAVPPEAPAISLVTGGGKKLRYPIDGDTERALRELFGAFVVRGGKREELPLPADLALPLEALDGIVRSTGHKYAGGYLQSGGKDAADRKALLDDLRKAGRIR